MGLFVVVRERSSRSLEKVGRFRVEGENIVIYLDGGAVEMMNLYGSGKGVKMVIQERLYVVGVWRVKMVLEGNEKKGALFQVK